MSKKKRRKFFVDFLAYLTKAPRAIRNTEEVPESYLFYCDHGCDSCKFTKKCDKIFKGQPPFIVKKELIALKETNPELFI